MVSFSLFAPLIWGTQRRVETTPQARDGFSGGAQANLRRRFRRFLGGRRKSRRREAAGRGNSPEAVPKEKDGGKGRMYRAESLLSEDGSERGGWGVQAKDSVGGRK